MTKLGKDISSDELEEIMQRHDVSGDKKISIDEFK
jgi:Ca2+-binding EF-hand superfamily protein